MKLKQMDSSKNTLCGYTWLDIYTSLGRAIGNGEMNRSQRWAAELLCSETGVSRLEALLLAIWAEHVGSALASWSGIWHSTVVMLRNEWIKAGGDNRKFRNSPNIRNRIAECVGYLVVSSKKPRPSMPKSADINKEAEAIKTRLHSGGASADQVSTRRVWDSTEDSPTMRTLGNELESAIRTAQTSRALFWLVWIMTLDSQNTRRPSIKERAPSSIQGKARKSLAWYVLAVLKDMANNGLDSNACISQTIDCATVVWMRLGSKSRKEVMGTIIVMLCERVKSAPIEVRAPQTCVDIQPIKAAMIDLDSIYEEIARDMKIVPTVVPGANDKTKNVLTNSKKEQKLIKELSAQESSQKMLDTERLMRKMYGMDDED